MVYVLNVRQKASVTQKKKITKKIAKKTAKKKKLSKSSLKLDKVSAEAPFDGIVVKGAKEHNLKDSYSVYKLKENDFNWKDNLPSSIVSFIKNDLINSPLEVFLNE